MTALWAPWSLRELVAELRSARTTPHDAAERARRRCTETESDVHAWVEFAPASAPSNSGALGGSPFQAVPLGGVPLGVKDIIDVAGLPTRCGSSLREDSPPAAADAAIVTAWRRAGALPLGKTVTTEFAYFAPGPTANPADLRHTPGGSSSGSAAAVAAGQVPLAIGSQTAGSVTRPAAFTGVAALVLTEGRLPTDGVVGLAPSLDSHGVFAAQVGDLQLAWSALSGSRERPEPTSDTCRFLAWSAAESGVVTPEMVSAFDRTTAALIAQGAEVVPFPEGALIAEATEAQKTVMAYEAARTRAVELASSDRLSAPLAALLGSGAALRDHEYETARALLHRARATVATLLETCDGVLAPAAPGSAPAGLDATGDPILSRAWQALGLPQVCIPGLRDDDGMPLGLQLVGAAGAESLLLARAAMVERTTTTLAGRGSGHVR